MVLLSARAGLRVAEIAGLSWDHVLTADMSAVAAEIDLPRQVTKGAKRARVIPIHEELKTALEEFRALWPVASRPRRYSHPRSPKAARSTPGGAYHPPDR